jgi:hypothetical protein
MIIRINPTNRLLKKLLNSATHHQQRRKSLHKMEGNKLGPSIYNTALQGKEEEKQKLHHPSVHD